MEEPSNSGDEASRSCGARDLSTILYLRRVMRPDTDSNSHHNLHKGHYLELHH